MDTFLNSHPDQPGFYQGVNRKMRMAWSGSADKPPLLFVHGSPGDWEGWVEFLLNEDLQKHFQLIAVDRPGYGGSDSGHAELSLLRQAEDIIAALQINKSGKAAILVGHSYGGAVIARMAVDNPKAVRGLIFVSSSVDPAQEKTKWYQYPATWWPIRKLIPQKLRVCNEEILALKGELEALEPKWSELSPAIAVASIQGQADKLVPPENQEFLRRKIPASQFVYMNSAQGMNHFVPWEHPELILQAIEKMETLGKAANHFSKDSLRK